MSGPGGQVCQWERRNAAGAVAWGRVGMLPSNAASAFCFNWARVREEGLAQRKRERDKERVKT